jgi:hypothetical protein
MPTARTPAPKGEERRTERRARARGVAGGCWSPRRGGGNGPSGGEGQVREVGIAGAGGQITARPPDHRRSAAGLTREDRVDQPPAEDGRDEGRRPIGVPRVPVLCRPTLAEPSPPPRRRLRPRPPADRAPPHRPTESAPTARCGWMSRTRTRRSALQPSARRPSRVPAGPVLGRLWAVTALRRPERSRKVEVQDHWSEAVHAEAQRSGEHAVSNVGDNHVSAHLRWSAGVREVLGRPWAVSADQSPPRCTALGGPRPNRTRVAVARGKRRADLGTARGAPVESRWPLRG